MTSSGRWPETGLQPASDQQRPEPWKRKSRSGLDHGVGRDQEELCRRSHNRWSSNARVTVRPATSPQSPSNAAVRPAPRRRPLRAKRGSTSITPALMRSSSGRRLGRHTCNGTQGALAFGLTVSFAQLSQSGTAVSPERSLTQTTRALQRTSTATRPASQSRRSNGRLRHPTTDRALGVGTSSRFARAKAAGDLGGGGGCRASDDNGSCGSRHGCGD
jgi:hypothetical protein